MILSQTYTLSNGVKIPQIGFGTWEIQNNFAAQAVINAVNCGYRHIDTAQGYANEQGVGEGIRLSGVNRDEIFVTTKLDAAVRTYKETLTAIDNSLKTMRLDYIDLMLIHSPQPWTEFREENRRFDENNDIWRAFEKAYKDDKLRSVGVSNFEKEDLDNILSSCSVPPMVNQILAHVGNMPFELISYTQSKGILVEAYSPIAHGEILKNEQIKAIAGKYGVTVPQIRIKYLLQLGLLPLSKAANQLHMASNADVFGFNISTEDILILSGVAPMTDYGEFAFFPVFGGKLNADGSYVSGKFKTRK